jgi:hypothetical protein
MNYEKIYNQIIERGKSRKLDGYKEKHHIIPKCIGGTNDNENLVELTAREHYICHKLLTEIYPTQNGLHYATFRMVHSINAMGEKRDYRICAREYQRLRENIVVSDETRVKMRISHQNISEETRRKIGEASLGRIPNDETRKKISDARLGKYCSEETKIKIGKIHKGKINSEETKNKISESLKEHFIINGSHKKGKQMSDAQKLKISKSMKGKKVRLGSKNKIKNE